MIEVERRGLLTESETRTLLARLLVTAVDLGRNDMNTRFYVFDDKTIKVAHMIQSNSAKLVAKPRTNKDHSYDEIELKIDPENLDHAYDFCLTLGKSKQFSSLIIRHDFALNGVELAIKYSRRWGFHVEAEIVVSAQSEVAKATTAINLVCRELGITLLSPDDESALERKFIEGLEIGVYEANDLPFSL